MREDLDRSLMRLLHGELSPEVAASLRRTIDGDPRVAARYAELEELWRSLELPPVAAAAAGLSSQVRRRLKDGRSPPQLALWDMPRALGRAVAAVAMAGGIGVGAWVGGAATPSDEAMFDFEPSLAESYWSAVEGDMNDAGWGDGR